MRHSRIAIPFGAAFLCAALLSPQGVYAKPLDSKRMERAKDFIYDEQWMKAIEELKAAADDPREPNKDEALFWLAHSQNQTRDSVAAVETVGRLERTYPKSPWVKPARSLRIEIAQRLRRNDVLWYTAAPPPAHPAPVASTPPAAPVPPAVAPARAPRVPPRPAEVLPMPPAFPTPAAATPLPPPAAPAPPPPGIWLPEDYFPDTDLRIQALGMLIRTDAPKVIPMLKEIALDSGNPSQARRALFVLAQSGRPDARSTVVEVAKTGPVPIRIAAVRELGRLTGAAVLNDLLQVYSTGNAQVKIQVVTSLGQREAAPALLRIAQSETDRRLREVAIVTLGEAGGREQLATLYTRASTETKRPIIIGLFNAHADDELIRIAERERDPQVRQVVLARLRLLGTPKAIEYLQKAGRR